MSVVITKPVSGSVLKGTVVVNATFSGSRFDVATVTLDGTQLGSDAAQPIAFSLDTTRVANGAKTLTVAVRYKTASGKLRWQKAAIQVTVDNTAALTKPSIPTGLSAVAGDKRITLSWNANPASESVDRYQVYEGDVLLLPENASPGKVVTADHLGNPLVNGSSYRFRISAHNAAGYGDWGAVLVATPVGPLPSHVSMSAPTVKVTP